MAYGSYFVRSDRFFSLQRLLSDLSLLWESENERRRSSWKMSKILGVSFFKGTVEEACKKAQSGGLVVAPSGPGMANDLPRCEIYAQALLNADLTLMDSGLIGLWSKFFKREKYTEFQGLLSEVLEQRILDR